LEARVPARLSPAEGRRFGITVGLAFLALALLFWWRGHAMPRNVAGVAAAIFIAGGVLLPAYLGPVYRVWMRGGLALSRVTTPIFMSIIFFLVITPFGLVARALGYRPLERRATDSFWRPRREGARKSDLQRQF
jgi:hypothetical protein